MNEDRLNSEYWKSLERNLREGEDKINELEMNESKKLTLEKMNEIYQLSKERSESPEGSERSVCTEGKAQDEEFYKRIDEEFRLKMEGIANYIDAMNEAKISTETTKDK